VRALLSSSGRSELAGPHAGRLTLTFDDGEMTGRWGCNTLFGTYEHGGERNGDLTFPRRRLGSTLVGCGAPPLLQRLLDVRHVSGSGGVRYLLAGDRTIVAELRRR
jgi:heat shock protein HslJ